jgi:hypothetical protein
MSVGPFAFLYAYRLGNVKPTADKVVVLHHYRRQG